MPQVAKLYFRTAILFLLVGIGVGLHMSMSGNHNVIGAHAHINLLGWVTSALFGGYFALNPEKATQRLAKVQFALYAPSVAVMCLSLYLMLLGNPGVEPILGASALVVSAGVLLFAVIVFAPDEARASHPPAALPAE